MKPLQFIKNHFLGETLLNELRRLRSFYNPVVRNHRLYLSKMDRFYSEFFNKNDLVFDVGANKGQMTELFLELGAKVVAIEPQPACVAFLHERFMGCKKLYVEPVALGAEKGVAEMNICLANPDFFWEDSSVFSTLNHTDNITERFKSDRCRWTKKEVTVTTLDDLIQKYGCPVYCKIDVEGYEESVLEGLNCRIPHLSFEYMIENHQPFCRCIQKLSKIGDYQYRFSPGHTYEFTTDDWLDDLSLSKHLTELSLSIPRLWGDIYASVFA